ncbi:MAG: glycerol kinase GlpK [Gammaproteobacteria bacterium]|nr:glycerol kinase GlpK [Gammaproteobacteria bacterium]
MTRQPLLLAIDQGTTSSRALVFDRAGRPLAVSKREFAQHYPRDGWVEHDPEEIWQTTLAACREALGQGAAAGTVAAIGIANQRETTIVWERGSGAPIYPAIVWQDRRTAARCEALQQAGREARIYEKTGLVLDAYFSATKIAWILDQVDGARRRAEAGELAFGTVDSFLIWRLSGGRHLTDATNASRTLLFNIHEQRWDDDLLEIFDVPAALLPEVLDCADHYGAAGRQWLGRALPIGGVAGDQQAALFGQACFEPGMLKSTYGTGCFVMMNSGVRPAVSKNRLLTTLGCRLGGRATYALEGSIFNAGTAIQWLRDNLGLFGAHHDFDALVASTHGNQGVYMVPAFTGLGAPHWDAHARAAILGLTRDTSKGQLVRAALEAVCYQTRDLLQAMRADSGADISVLRVDGGMVVNDWLLQFLADVAGVKVQRPAALEATAWGAAGLAGLHCGVFNSLDDISRQWRKDRDFQPAADRQAAQASIAGWNDALRRVKSGSGGD